MEENVKGGRVTFERIDKKWQRKVAHCVGRIMELPGRQSRDRMTSIAHSTCVSRHVASASRFCICFHFAVSFDRAVVAG